MPLGSAFAKQIVQQMKERITGIFLRFLQFLIVFIISGDGPVRFKEYSGHDVSIVALLIALGMITNDTDPRLHVGYANSVIFELRYVIFNF